MYRKLAAHAGGPAGARRRQAKRRTLPARSAAAWAPAPSGPPANAAREFRRSSWHGCKRANCSRGRRLWPAAGGGRHTRWQERRWCWRPLVADLSCEPGPSSTIISKFLGNFIPVALAEWLRRWPAKPLCSARVGSSPSGDEISFFCINLTPPPRSCRLAGLLAVWPSQTVLGVLACPSCVVHFAASDDRTGCIFLRWNGGTLFESAHRLIW